MFTKFWQCYSILFIEQTSRFSWKMLSFVVVAVETLVPGQLCKRMQLLSKFTACAVQLIESFHLCTLSSIVAEQIQLLLCKLITHSMNATLSITFSIQHDLCLTVTVGSEVVTSSFHPLLISVSKKLASACNWLCNPDPRFQEQWKQKISHTSWAVWYWKVLIWLISYPVTQKKNIPTLMLLSLECRAYIIVTASGFWQVTQELSDAPYPACSACAINETNRTLCKNPCQHSVIVYTYILYYFAYSGTSHYQTRCLKSKRFITSIYQLLLRQYDRLCVKMLLLTKQPNARTYWLYFWMILTANSFQRIFWQQQELEAATQRDPCSMRSWSAGVSSHRNKACVLYYKWRIWVLVWI